MASRIIRKMQKGKLWILGIVAVFVLTAAGESYFEVNKNLELFSSFYKELLSNYADPVDQEKVVKSGIDAMLASLDPYTTYIPESDMANYKFQTTGKYGGIGATVRDLGDYIVIAEPYEGFPAHKAGLKAGDAIISIDGTDCKGKSVDDISHFLKGPAGSIINITIQRPGQKDLLSIPLQREEIHLNAVSYAGILDGQIGYVRFTQFTDNCARDLERALKQLKKENSAIKGWIIDLRGNPGGLLTEAVDVANLFVPKNSSIVSTRGRKPSSSKMFKALNEPFDETTPLVVLTARNSASASEIVAGAIQDLDRGIIVGQRSFGKGLVQTTFPLTGLRAQVKITTAKYYTPSGRCIQALDYSHRNVDGSVDKVADSLKHAFLTMKGRTVYDGGGIEPDAAVAAKEYSQLLSVLVSKNLLFEYATQYVLNHPTIGSVKDWQWNEIADLEQFLETRSFTYEAAGETEISLLQKKAKENGEQELLEELKAFKASLHRSLHESLQENKSELSELLSTEIASRYTLQKGRFQNAFQFDADIKEATRLLKDKSAYEQLLQLKK